jgi:hypothetical protein
MRANVVQCVNAGFRSANDDLTAADGAHAHGASGEFGERNVNVLSVVQGCVPN